MQRKRRLPVIFVPAIFWFFLLPSSALWIFSSFQMLVLTPREYQQELLVRRWRGPFR